MSSNDNDNTIISQQNNNDNNNNNSITHNVITPHCMCIMCITKHNSNTHNRQ